MKKLLLIAVLLVSASIAFAQDKYQFMTVQYETARQQINISIDGSLFLKEIAEVSKEENPPANTNPLLKKINEYQDKGWEVMSINPYAFATYYGHVAYLRKKKTN